MDSSFTTWRAYSNFEREVSRNRRFIRTASCEAFLDAVRQSCQHRRTKISEGRKLWRAQVGHTWRRIEEIDDDVPAAFLPDRMKPLRDRAMDGRANPKGVPVLYLCSNRDAAMSEVRPWLGSMISLGQFVTNRKLALVDCTRQPDNGRRFYFAEPPEEQRSDIVWSEIDRAFTTPVTRSDDSGDYVATQVLAELFKAEGYDGIAYRSAFGENSVNFALFDLDAASLASCELQEATSAKINFRERDTPYWVSRAHNQKSR